MSVEFVQEAARLSRDLGRITRQATLSSEVPIRLHSREIDSGGAPEFHPAFLRYIESGVCHCGRDAICAPGCHFAKERALGHLDDCQPACPKDDTRFHASKHKNGPNRLNRALRQVRRLNPHAYDLCFLIAGRGYSWSDATSRLRADDLSRGKPERTDAEFAVLWISGASMLAASW